MTFNTPIFVALSALATFLFGPTVLLAGAGVHHGEIGALEGFFAIVLGRTVRAVLRRDLGSLPPWFSKRRVVRLLRSCLVRIQQRYGSRKRPVGVATWRSIWLRRAMAVPVFFAYLVAAFWWAHWVTVVIGGWRFLVALVFCVLAVATLSEQRWRSHPRAKASRALRVAAAASRRIRLRFGPAVLATLAVVPLWAAPQLSLGAAVEGVLAEESLELRGEKFHWVDATVRGRTRMLNRGSVLLVAGEAGAPSDVYLVDVSLSHEGAVARASTLYNLSETPLVDEKDLQVVPGWAIWRVEHEGATTALELADMTGEGTLRGPGWSLRTRVQRAITNLQETGRTRGIGRTNIKLVQPGSASFALDTAGLEIRVATGRVRVELGRNQATGPATDQVELGMVEPPLPGNFTTWAVDRLRAVRWIGSDGMQWIKALAFRTANELEELEDQVIGIDAQEAVSEQLGDVLETLPLVESSTIPGWPPEPVAPVISPVLPGEGRWVGFDGDPVVARPDDGQLPPPFVFSFIRVDKKRPYNQVSFVLWDPRRLRLHVVAGSREPKSTTGELGSGEIPRDPAVLDHLVGAFNGAFQAVHGEFGMVERRRVILPPKPYAATVATLTDGSAGFGTWPLDAPLPADVLSLRQNLTPLLVDDQINPYGRTYWGGVPENWTDDTRTVRSGLCLTREGFIAYFYTPSADPITLARAMQQVRCSYGIHLDMNAGHTGFEFYRVVPTGSLPAFVKAPDPSWEARGQVTGVDGREFASRLMVRSMPLMNFPRYIHPSSRDFFYLTRRPLLPPPPTSPLLPAFPEDGTWRAVSTAGKWPISVAETRLHAPGAKDKPRPHRVWALDPKLLGLAPPESTTAPEVTLRLAGGKAEGHDAWLVWSATGPEVVRGSPPPPNALIGGAAEPASGSKGALCVSRSGMLLAITPEERATEDVSSAPVLDALDCAQRIYLAEGPRVSVTSTPPNPAADSGQVYLAFERRSFSGAQRIFSDTPFLPQHKWGLVQARRPKYVPPAPAAP